LWLFILGKRLIETRAHDLVVCSVVAGVMANSYLAKVLEQCKCAGMILITDDVDDTTELMQPMLHTSLQSARDAMGDRQAGRRKAVKRISERSDHPHIKIHANSTICMCSFFHLCAVPTETPAARASFEQDSFGLSARIFIASVRRWSGMPMEPLGRPSFTPRPLAAFLCLYCNCR